MKLLLVCLLILSECCGAADGPGTLAPTAVIEIPGEREGGIRIGKESAPVVVMVFTDYTCPHCWTLHREGLEALRKSHVDPGKVVFEIRHLPRLDEKSLGLVRAALAAERAVRGNMGEAPEGKAAVGTEKGGGKGEETPGESKPGNATGGGAEAKVADGAAVDWRVWEFQKALFEFAGVLPEKAFPALAGEKGIDEEAFRAAWDAMEVRGELLADADLADAVGLKTLPAVVVFPNRPGKKSAGIVLEGEDGVADLEAEIERAAETAVEP